MTYYKGQEMTFECEYDPIPLAIITLLSVLNEVERIREKGYDIDRASWFDLMFTNLKILQENGYFDKKEVSE